jgi:two-component system NtrC family response regulator
MEALPDLDLRSARLRAERDVVQEALARSNNTLTVAARLLGVSRPTLYALMEAHGLGSEPKSSDDDIATCAEATVSAETTI